MGGGELRVPLEHAVAEDAHKLLETLQWAGAGDGIIVGWRDCEEGGTLLPAAAQVRNWRVVTSIRSAEAKSGIDVTNTHEKWAALDHAEIKGHADVTWVLMANADVNVSDSKGCTRPLHVALRGAGDPVGARLTKSLLANS